MVENIIEITIILGPSLPRALGGHTFYPTYGLALLTMVTRLNMSSLAAAAIECRLDGDSTVYRKIVENKQDKCSVRVQGNLLVRYLIRPVAGPKLPPYMRQEIGRTPV